MRLTATHTIQAPIGLGFKEFSNFDKFETFAKQRGVKVARTDDLTGLSAGMAWRVSGNIRDKTRIIDITLTDLRPGIRLGYASQSGAMSGQFRVEFDPTMSTQTTVTLKVIDPVAKSLPARLILQSVKLAKHSIEKRMLRALIKFGDEIEQLRAAS